MPTPTQDEQDRRFNAAMSRVCKERGYLNLAQAHALAAKDCPRGCRCDGCAEVKRDSAERRERREMARTARKGPRAERVEEVRP